MVSYLSLLDYIGQVIIALILRKDYDLVALHYHIAADRNNCLSVADYACDQNSLP